MSIARRRVVLAVKFSLTAIAIADPDIDLIVIAARADVLHDEVLLEVWEPGDLTWRVKVATLLGRIGKCCDV